MVHGPHTRRCTQTFRESIRGTEQKERRETRPEGASEGGAAAVAGTVPLLPLLPLPAPLVLLPLLAPRRPIDFRGRRSTNGRPLPTFRPPCPTLSPLKPSIQNGRAGGLSRPVDGGPGKGEAGDEHVTGQFDSPSPATARNWTGAFDRIPLPLRDCLRERKAKKEKQGTDYSPEFAVHFRLHAVFEFGDVIVLRVEASADLHRIADLLQERLTRGAKTVLFVSLLDESCRANMDRGPI